MGYAFGFGNCYKCGRPFPFNPNHVPSIRVEGIREPVCKPCVDAINTAAVANGQSPFVYPDDAYEACEESEL